MKKSLIAIMTVALSMPIAAYAVEAHHQPGATGAAASAQMSDGEVRKIDTETKKITLRHGPIQNLGMPPMTMVFQVKDVAMLDQVKAGDKVKFSADKVNGAYTVIHIESAK